jgi:hypothetical protein
MPQARSGGSSSSSGAGGTSRRRSSAGSARGAGARTSSRASSASTGSADERFEAAAQRLRKLNERVIEASRGAGEGVLSSYEKALKTMAAAIERGPGRSDVEWISQLATTQAKFIRDVTEAWASAARNMMK